MALNLEQANSGTFTLTKGGLAIGSTPSQLSTANIIQYVIDGIWQTQKAAQATFALAVPPQTRIDPVTGATINVFAYTNIGIGQKAAFGVWLDAAGNLTVTQGTVVGVNSNSDRAMFATNPGSRALVGAFTVYNGSAAAFIPGTTAFNAAGITTTYYDTFSLVGVLGL